ncbi:MAG TPA: hypothetical protein VI382_10705 [Candidatus Manganitrophaceae bacterium]|nr:hypothetical protein [Candidatus Manganitrophaceae bacterium]
MKTLELEEKVRLLEKEIDILAEQVDQLKLDAKEHIDTIKIELATLKALMSEISPQFKTRYLKIKKKIEEKFDPETLTL